MTSSRCLGQTAGTEQGFSDSACLHAAAPGVGTSRTEGNICHLIALNFSSLNLITFSSHLEFWPPQPPVADGSVV